MIKKIILFNLFFFSFLVGCEKKHIDKNLYNLSRVNIKIAEDTSCERLKLTLSVFAQYDKTVRVVGSYSSQSSLFANAPKVLPNSLNSEMKIIKFHVKTIPTGDDLTTILETKTGKKIEDFIKNINTDFGNKYGAIIKEEAIFYSPTPKKILGKDFRIIFSIERKDGFVMADTTKNIHLN